MSEEIIFVDSDGKLKSAASTTPFPVELKTSSAIIGKVNLNGHDASAFEQITVDGTAKTLTALTYGTKTSAVIIVETDSLRYTVDGTTPTASVGMLAYPGDVIELDSLADITAFKAIRTSSVSALISVTYSSGVA